MPRHFTVAVIGHTGRGDYGHGLDVVWRAFDNVQIVAVADADEKGRAAARKMTSEFPVGPKGTFNFRFKRKDGSDLNVLMTISPIKDENGTQIRSLALINEVS